jgi:hypothetical protein
MSNFLPWLQERVKHWLKPATPLISGLLSDLLLSYTDLIAENALLRQQLIVLNRPTNPDRFRLVFLTHFTRFWKPSLHIVQPDTLLRWHGNCFASIDDGRRNVSPRFRPKRSS